MKIVVLGGSGLIGFKLVNLLHQSCLDAISASRTSGVNTVTGEGLDEALEGAEMVVDVTRAPSLQEHAALEFYESSGRNIVAAEIAAGVEHHVTLSIVGINRLQGGGYFRAKMVQEKLIQESPVPYTILRSTQFFEFMGGIADAGTVGDTVLVSPALFQPVASDDVAASLVDITLSRPVNGIVEVAGPERVHLAELVKRFLSETCDTRKVVADVNARYFGAVLNDSTLIPGENPRLGSQTFEAWLSQSRVKA